MITEEERSNLYAKCNIVMNAQNQPFPALSFEEIRNAKQAAVKMITDVSKCFVVQLNDDSMAPRFARGTHLFVDASIKPKHGDFVLAYVKAYGKNLFRQYLMEDDEPELHPLHPNADRVDLSYEDKILGTVVETRLEFNKE